MKVAVIGNSSFNLSFGVAADLALAGHDVALAAWPDATATLDSVRVKGLELRGEAGTTISSKRGKSPVRLCDTPPQAVEGAEMIFLDMPPERFEACFSLIAPHLTPGQVVHVDSQGYWPALRLWPIVMKSGISDVTLTESSVRSMAVHYEDGVVTSRWLRPGLPIAAMPAARSAYAVEKLKMIYPTAVAAGSVLETGFSNLNMLIHPSLALLNVGWFDRSLEKGQQINFYGPGNTQNTTKLALALDDERKRVCEAFDADFRSVTEYLCRFYRIDADGLRNAIASCTYYNSIPMTAPDIWQRWVRLDMAYAHVPFAEVARLAGTPTPLQDAMISIYSVLLDEDFRKTGIGLSRLGLAGMPAKGVRDYVHSGAI